MTTAVSVRSAERRGLLLAFLVFGCFWGAWSAVLPAIRSQTHLSDGRLGLALGAVACAAVPVMPVAGRLVDRLGAGRALPATLLAFTVVLPAAGLAHSLATLVPALLLLGLATGALDVVANTAAAGWERVEADRLMSIAHGAFSVGVLVGSASAGLAREAGATPLPILLTVAALVLAVAASQPAYRKADLHEERGSRAGLSAVLLGIGLLTAGAFLCEDAIQSWSALHLERGLQAGPAVSGLGPGLFAGSMAAGRLASGLVRVREDVQFGTSAALLAGGVLLVALAPSAPYALVGLAIAGAGTSVLAPVLYSAVGARAAPGRQGADLARVSTLGYVGFVAGPPLVGAVSAASSLPVALGSLAVVAIALTIGGPMLLRPSGKMGA
ncbi:MAG: major facilitator superfamily transporter [Frankiales bacterium]|nr:major facilitator superfamily transporter [Frankiales bacterium]